MNKNHSISNLTFIMLSILFFISSCSTPKSAKQINLIDRNITNIQSEVKEVKNNIKKTKDNVKTLKEQYKQIINTNCGKDKCNNSNNITNIINAIEDKIEILDIQINSIDNNLSNTKEQLKISRDIIKTEIKEYKYRYIRSKMINAGLIVLIIFIMLNKINIGGMVDWIRRVFDLFKK